MTLKNNKPVLAVVGFNLFTLLVFVTAPVKWNTDRVAELCSFVLLCQALVTLGFRMGRHAAPDAILRRRPPLFSGKTLFTWLYGIYLLTFPISYAYKMGYSPFNITGMLSQLWSGLHDPRSAYMWTLDKVSGGQIRWSVYFAISVFNQLFFLVGFLRWRHLGWVKRTVFVGLLAMEVFYWVGTATTFGVVSLTTTFGLSAMFWQVRFRRWGIRRLAFSLVLLGVLLGGTVVFFSYNMARRGNFSEIDVYQYEIAESPIIADHPTLSVIPTALLPTYLKAASYLAQGYYHTCLAFDLDFRSTMFLGNNPTVVGLASAFGVDVWEDTYVHRLERKGINEFGVWHSAYTWFASDVSFYGVPVELFVLAYMFGFSWAQGVRGDFLSRVVFILFGNVLLFLFANNTYLSSVFSSFVVFVPLWLLTRWLRLPQAARGGGRPALARAGGSPRPTDGSPGKGVGSAGWRASTVGPSGNS
jgi:hypothetical protein